MHVGNAMVPESHPGFGSHCGGSGSGRHNWKTYLAPRPLDIHHMVMMALGDQPIGLAI